MPRLTLLFSLLIMLLTFNSVRSAPREFTDHQGRKVMATFVGMRKSSVGLRLASGKVVYFPLNKLSAEDREYIRTHPTRKLPQIVIDPGALYSVDSANPHYIDHQGNKKFDGFHRHSTTEQFKGKTAKVELGGIYNAFIDQKGKILLSSKDLGVYSFLGEWTDDLILTHQGNPRRHGYVDQKGKTVIPFQYGMGMPMRCGRAWVTRDDVRQLRDKAKATWILIDAQGQKIATLPKGATPSAFSDGYCIIDPADDKRPYYCDVQGQRAFAGNTGLRNIRSFQNGIAHVDDYLINTQGEWIISPKSDWTLSYYGKVTKSGVVLATKKLKSDAEVYVLLAKTGEVIAKLPSGYDRFANSGDGFISVRNSKEPHLWGCLDRLGNVVFKPQFLSAPTFENGFGKASIMIKGKKRLVVINHQGKVIWTRPW